MDSSTFLTGGEEIPEPHGMKKVRDLHGQLQDTVSNLSTKITVLLREREKDFLAAYRHHMYNVQKDLQEAKRSVKKAKDDLRNNDQIKKLKKERDWFRNEALRLEKLSKTQEKEIDSIQLKTNTLREDRVWFEKQLKIAKRQIKILTAELGMQLHRGAEHVNQPRPQALNYHDGAGNDDDGGGDNDAGDAEEDPAADSPRSRPGSSRGGVNRSGQRVPSGPRSSHLDRSGSHGGGGAGTSSSPLGGFGGGGDGNNSDDNVNDLRHTIEELREKLRDSRRRNRNLQAVVNHSNKAGQYEEVFFACVEEVKKEAARRREKLLLSQRKSRREVGALELHGIQVTARQELDELTVQDKRRILEQCLNHPDVFEYLHTALFASDAEQRTRSPHHRSNSSSGASGLPRIE